MVSRLSVARAPCLLHKATILMNALSRATRFGSIAFAQTRRVTGNCQPEAVAGYPIKAQLPISRLVEALPQSVAFSLRPNASWPLPSPRH